METIEEIKQELFATKERLERALARIGSAIERLDTVKVEDDTVTLRIRFESERDETITIPRSRLCDLEERTSDSSVMYGTTWLIVMRVRGPLSGKAFLLNTDYYWELGKDEEGALCLVPFKKEK